MSALLNKREVELYFDLAARVANQSYAVRLKVGAVLVLPSGLISIGYNGTPSGWSNVCEDRVEVKSEEELSGAEYYDNGKYYKLTTRPEVTHAEGNIFNKLLAEGVSSKDGILFLTHSPCLHCAKQIVGAKVKAVYYKDEYRSLDGIEHLRKAGIYVEHYTKEQVCDN